MAMSFEKVIKGLKVVSKQESGMFVNGPLSNGDYTIEFENKVKFIIYPNLRQKNGLVIIDFICIPQTKSYDLTNTFDISKVMLTFLPGKKYLYDTSTIERSMSRTACIRFSLNQKVLEDVGAFISTIEFMRDNTNIILQEQLEYHKQK